MDELNNVPGAGSSAHLDVEYEFTEEENRPIAKCAFWAKALGILLFVMAGIDLINLDIFSVAINIVVGVSSCSAGTRSSGWSPPRAATSST